MDAATSRLCECGCGEETNIIKTSSYTRGRIRGQYSRFVRGHQNRRPTEERFWEKVDKGDPNECWNWKAGKFHAGHGQFTIKPHPPVKAHRWLWQQIYGELPREIHLHHVCQNPSCVNPTHLLPVTAGEHNTIHKSKF